MGGHWVAFVESRDQGGGDELGDPVHLTPGIDDHGICWNKIDDEVDEENGAKSNEADFGDDQNP